MVPKPVALLPSGKPLKKKIQIPRPYSRADSQTLGLDPRDLAFTHHLSDFGTRWSLRAVLLADDFIQQPFPNAGACAFHPREIPV